MEKVFNKLVRDNIPEIIENNNATPYTRILSDEEYKTELEKKLLEEYREVLKTTTREERLEELADMLEIIQCLAIIEDYTYDELIDLTKSKRLERGGFEKKLFLEKTIEN